MKVSLRKQLNVWKSVLFALFLREMQSQFNDKLGLAWAFIEPFAFIFGLSYMRSMMGGGDVHSIPVFIFMMIGMIIFYTMIILKEKALLKTSVFMMAVPLHL